MQGLVLTSDLQGLAIEPHDPRLLGEALAEELATLCDVGVLPPGHAMGVILAGDLYAAPGADRLGVSGDATPAWLAFQQRFRWVCGVAGNHDRFGSDVVPHGFSPESGLYFLDADQVDLDGLRIAGVGGIIGKPLRQQRHGLPELRARILRVLQPRPDLLVMHEGPDLPESGLKGQPMLRELLYGTGLLIVSGHCHWPVPLVDLGPGTQVLNVDARAVVLVNAGHSA